MPRTAAVHSFPAEPLRHWTSLLVRSALLGADRVEDVHPGCAAGRKDGGEDADQRGDDNECCEMPGRDGQDGDSLIGHRTLQADTEKESQPDTKHRNPAKACTTDSPLGANGATLPATILSISVICAVWLSVTD